MTDRSPVARSAPQSAHPSAHPNTHPSARPSARPSALPGASRANGTLPRVRPSGALVRTPDVDERVLCGQRVVAYVAGWSVEEAVRRTGHGRHMTVREIKALLDRATTLAPTPIPGDRLRAAGAELWFTHGADRFLGILVEKPQSPAPDALGHVVVLDGTLLLDPPLPLPLRTAKPHHPRDIPALLASYDACLVLHRGGSPR